MNTDTAIRANRTLHILFYGSDRLSAYWSRIEEMRECPGNNAGLIRAIYSDSPILMLDEATSALDEATEKELLRNLRDLTDKTVVIVTHRPEALKICDRVIEFG